MPCSCGRPFPQPITSTPLAAAGQAQPPVVDLAPSTAPAPGLFAPLPTWALLLMGAGIAWGAYSALALYAEPPHRRGFRSAYPGGR